MSRVDKNTWSGSSRRNLETEIANKRYMLHNMHDLDNRCKKAGVQLSIDVCVGQNPKSIVVDEAKNSGAYHVVVDKTMKKDRKYFIENLTCFVTRVRASGGAESIRSFAVSKPTPRPPAGGPTPFNTQASSFYMSSHLSNMHSKTSSESGSSLHGGSSQSSTTFNQSDFKEHHGRLGPLSKHHSTASMTSATSTSSLSMGFDTQSSFDDLFSINHDSISERDASLCESIPMTPDHHNAGPGFGVPSSRPDIPRNPIPRPQWHARSNAPQINDSLKTSTSVSASPHIPKQSVVVRPSLNTSYRNTTLSRSSSGDVGGSEVSGRSFESARNLTLSRSSSGEVGGGLSEGSGRSFESARSTGSAQATGSGRSSPQRAISNAIIGNAPPTANGWSAGSGRSSPQRAMPNSNTGSASPTANGWSAGSGRSSPQRAISTSNIGSAPPTENGWSAGSGRSSPQHAISSSNIGSATPTGSGWSVGSGRTSLRQAASKPKIVWVWTKSKDVMMAAVEGGWSTFVFTPETMDLAHEWTSLAKINPLYLEGGQFLNAENKQVAVLGQIALSEQVESLDGWEAKVVVMSALDWQIIPAEIMVAAFQDSSTALYATASSANDARFYLEASEKGTDGIVLQTDDVSEVFALKAYLKDKKEPTMGIALVEAVVTQVEHVGMGDRVCVDLCNLLHPGEGLLVGSFARALFLIHSECLENNYVASRSFRVNAGPVHAYVGMAGGRTEYLSELHTGSQVLVVDALGHTRSVLVGRVKIESRPLLLVEVEVDGQRHSVLLQNAETVCLVAPGDNTASKAVPVTNLQVGDKLLLSLQEEARHPGIHIEEFLMEK
ncbi:hypothetical protein KC19_10G157000 [Ceratodon purpureus]|nr:hypothetical protein KC19_10G157000 [Ceratodon purpureus]